MPLTTFGGHSSEVMTRAEIELEAEQLSVISKLVSETAVSPEMAVATPHTLLTHLQQTHPHLIDDYTLELITACQNGLNK